MRKPLGLLMAATLLASLAQLGAAGPAAAAGPCGSVKSHFRYGNISWVRGTAARQINFKVSQAWRRSAYSGSGTDGLPCVGDQVTTGSLAYGDGNADPLTMVVTSVDTANDWFFAQAVDPNNGNAFLSHTYASSGTFTAFYESCCRIGQVDPNANINNPDVSERQETIVDVGAANDSPSSTLVPIVNCASNAVCSFKVPASDPNGDPLHFRMSTSSEAVESGDSFTQPGPPQAPNAASINAATGVYTWDTTGATMAADVGCFKSNGDPCNTLYSTQVMIEDLDGAGAVKSKVPVDFLIQIGGAATGSPPVFDSPPTPACSSTIQAFVGFPTSFTVQASDSDAGDVVTLQAAGLPPGATMTPPLPATGNPVTSQFDWTPSASDVGSTVIDFSATDQSGSQVLCDLTLSVGTGTPQADLAVSKSDSPDPVFVGNKLTYTLGVSNAGPIDAVNVTVSDSLPAGVTYVSATPSQGSCSGKATVTCDLGNLASGDSATVTIVVTVDQPGKISNTAVVSSDTPDPNMANNSATSTTTANAKPVGGVQTGTRGDAPALPLWALLMMAAAAFGAAATALRRITSGR